MPKLFYTPLCPNCSRFITTLNGTSAAATVQKVNIDTLPPRTRAQITKVPLLVTDEGQTLVGTAAFTWLSKFQDSVDLQSYTPSRGLGFASLDDSSDMIQYAMPWSTFTPDGPGGPGGPGPA